MMPGEKCFLKSGKNNFVLGNSEHKKTMREKGEYNKVKTISFIGWKCSGETR